MSARITGLLFLVVMNGCLGVNEQINWTPSLDRKLLEIYNLAYPSEGGHEERMKSAWDRELPRYKDQNVYELIKRAQLLMGIKSLEKKKMQNKIIPKSIDKHLSHVYSIVENDHQDVKKMMREKLNEMYPQYREFAPETIRKKVAKWYKENKIDEKALKQRGSRWSNQLNADLMHVYNRVKEGGKTYFHSRMKKEWLRMHPEDYNLKTEHLKSHFYELQRQGYVPTTEESERARRRHEEMSRLNGSVSGNRVKRSKWPRQYNADLIHVFKQIESEKGGSIATRLKTQIVKLHPDLEFVDKRTMLKHASRLRRRGYEPLEFEKEDAKIKYERILQSERARAEKKRAVPEEAASTKKSQQTANEHVRHDNQYLDDPKVFPRDSHYNIDSSLDDLETFYHYFEDEEKRNRPH